MEDIAQQILALAIVAVIVVIALIRLRRKRRRSATGGNPDSNPERSETPVQFIRKRKRSKK